MLTRDKFLTDFDLICENFADNIAVSYVENCKTTLGVTFNELNRVSKELSRYFLRIFQEKTRYVGVFLSDRFLLPCLILGIWKSGWAFAGVGDQYTIGNTLHYLNFLNVKYIITDSSDNKYDGEIISRFCIYKQDFFVWRRKIKEKEENPRNWDFCYGIMTSGSTGLPKIIQVPWFCILQNVHELCDMFGIIDSDCVLQASPCTFDPFFVELFLSLLKGCSLMIVSDLIRLNASSLVEALFNENDGLVQPHSYCNTLKGDNNYYINVKHVRRKNVTVMQMTPSIFKRWSDVEIKEIILSPKTSLRVLVLGGEKFPSDILNLKSCGKKTRIFNIYGITEVSCWAFVSEVTNHSPGMEVSLGKSLTNITFKINQNDELLIGSESRICLVDDENEVQVGKSVYRNTGDVVRELNGELYYVNRSNQIVKKFGIKVNLNKIEKAYLECNKLLKECLCVFDEDNCKLGLFYVPICGNNSNEESVVLMKLKDFIESGCEVPNIGLSDIERPDFLFQISQIPLNSHGKVDREVLLTHMRNLVSVKPSKVDLRKTFEKIVCDALGLPKITSKSFTDLGLTSVLALQITNELEEIGVRFSQDFLSELLKGGNVESCLKCLSLDEAEGGARKKIKVEGEELMDVIEDVTVVNVRWKYDLGKCVDATPSVFTSQGRERLVVGSHSTRLSCLDVDSGDEVWTTSLGDRIESAFAITKDGKRGFVGCYDHFVYCLLASNGSVLWKYETGDMIKSTPCLSTDEKIVYVASYDKCLYCLSASGGQLIQKVKLSEGGIFSTGLVSNSLLTFYIGTLDGTCVGLSQTDNRIVWKSKLETPIFASPCLNSKDAILFAEVLGVVHCFNAVSGAKIWSYKADGNIYSSPVAQISGEATLIVFGCHDAHVYCLRDGDTPELEWKRRLKSSVFARPCVFALESEPDNWMICAATTKGFVCLCDFISGSLKTESKLNGEVFSSPVFSRNRLFVGCRDNYVYSLDVRLIKQD